VLDANTPAYFAPPSVTKKKMGYNVKTRKEEVTQCRVNGLDIVLGSSRKISPCTSCTCTKEGVRKHIKKSSLSLSNQVRKCGISIVCWMDEKSKCIEKNKPSKF
jgi:hypothetical protein